MFEFFKNLFKKEKKPAISPKAAFSEENLTELKDLIKKLEQNTISISYKQKEQELSVGASKFGGKPDVPAEFIWPYNKGEGINGETKNRPLSLLAQFNLAEIASFDADNLLPKTGFLYFFYDLPVMPWEVAPKDKGAKVFYFDCDLQQLKRREYPADYDEESLIPEFEITFAAQKNYPDYEEFCNYTGELSFRFGEFEVYDEILEELGQTEMQSSKLLGYADIVQNDMTFECEMSSMGMKKYPEYGTDKYNAVKNNAARWQLLFQMGTVSTYTDYSKQTSQDFELMFGDDGNVYFYISKEDLKNKNFANCQLILQCY